jgi:hypothetical protein
VRVRKTLLVLTSGAYLYNKEVRLKRGGAEEMKALIASVLLLLAGGGFHPPRTRAARQGPKPQTQAILPDLMVTSVVLINAEKGEFKVTVKNRGKGGAAVCQLRLTIIERHGKQVLKIASAEQPPIKPHVTAVLIISAQMSLSTLKYLITTDAANEIPETNERNNTYEGDIERY